MTEIIIGGLLATVAAVTLLFPLYLKKKDPTGLRKKQKHILLRIRVTAVLACVLQFIPPELFRQLDTDTLPFLGQFLRLAAYLFLYGLIGHDILKKAWKGIRNKQVFDENFLMAVATVGALALAVTQNGDYLEAIAVLLFYQLGELFQSYAVGKSRRSIQALMDIRPDSARLEQDGTLVTVDPDGVAVGSVLVVHPGERIPIDGIVTEGGSALNTSALTGESLPREVSPGDAVLSGCINLTGILKLRTTKPFGESTVSKILELVENASSRKAKSQDFIGKFARVYTPAVCCGALALAVLPPVARLLFLGLPPDFGSWLYRALTFLVISCPCALVISIPLSFFAGIGGASRAGVLIKGANFLETLSHVKTVVFDKTGTLTKGVFQVSAIHTQGMDQTQLLHYAAHVESASSHPIAGSILSAYGKAVDHSRIAGLREISGCGMVAAVDETPVAVGNSRLMQRLSIPCAEAPGTVVHIAVDNRYAGAITVSDTLKPTAGEAIRRLKQSGIRKTVMLTGDSTGIAQSVGRALGVDEIHSQLLPGDKVQAVERLLADCPRSEKVAFVGDGINDAPVLSRADVGIAMGALGSDAAIEAADVVLMDDDPMKIVAAIRISRRCIAIVYQNIVFALAVKFACLALGAMGIANMWFAIFADVGVMVLAVLNAMRALSRSRNL